MKLIDIGLKKRILDVQVISSNDEDVKVAERDFYKYYAELEKILGNGHPVLLYLEESVNNLRFFELVASYRVGVSDGMQLQQEVNGMIHRKEV